MIIFLSLPLWYHFLMVGILGLIIGSFLNVLIYRLHTGKSLAGHSHCLSCGNRLRAYELIPLLSYLALRGKCRVCGCYIPIRYFLVELGTAALFIASYLVSESLAELLLLFTTMSILVTIVVYDIRHFIIPDKLTIALALVSVALLVADYLVGVPYEAIAIDVFAALLGSSFFFFLWFISKGRWLGFGDVKLAFPLGLLVGAPFVFSMVVFSFWIGAAVSLALLGLGKIQRGKLYLRFASPKLTIKSVVPFAPFLIAGCLLVLFTHLNVLSLFTL